MDDSKRTQLEKEQQPTYRHSLIPMVKAACTESVTMKPTASETSLGQTRHTKRSWRSGQASCGEEAGGDGGVGQGRPSRRQRNKPQNYSKISWCFSVICFHAVEIGTASRMLWVHLFFNFSCRQDSEQLESAALTMLYVSWERREIKWVCGRWRQRVKWARERGIWKPSPGHRRKWPRQNWYKRTIRLERPKHPSAERKRNRRRARTAANKQPSNRAENLASLGVKEQCLEASPLRDQISVIQRSYIKYMTRAAGKPPSQSRTEMKARFLVP